MIKKIKILHITPHLGTGVGTVVLNYLAKVGNRTPFEHKVICLDYANQNSIEVSKKVGFVLLGDMSKNKPEVLRMIAESDIVLIHWWNHPLLYDFLVKETLPPSRVIFWSHVSGSVPPNNFTDKALKYPDIFAFTTPISRKVGEVRCLPLKYKKRLRDVWSTGGLERIKSVKPKKHIGFNVGYIGTVDYTKMHPDFLEMCNQVNIPDVKFIVVGGPNAKLLEQEADRRGIGHKFKFTGFVSEEEKWDYLSTFDVFGYPLAPHHYGSSDQALQEAMGAGVAPVVMNNLMESYMVKNLKTGIVSKSKKEYVRGLEKLYRDKKLRSRLSKNAKKYATKTFSLKNMEREWNKIFKETLKIDKTEREWSVGKTKKNISSKDVFLESIGKYSKNFAGDKAKEKIKKLAQSPNWQSKSKGTVHQYNAFLPSDKYLAEWVKLMSKK